MKLPSKTLCLVVASVALVAAGCSKKPARPDPSATVMGPAGGGAGSSSLNPMDIATTTPMGGLESRDAGFDANNQNRQALADQTVYFDFDSSNIKASERPKLQQAKDYLDKNPGYRLLLEGHCDWRGTAEYNLALGDRRAGSAKKYLQSLGISPDRLETLSKGSLEATKNGSESVMAKERCVNLVVVNPAGGMGALPASGTAAPGGPAAGELGAAPLPANGGL
jgi:peptidoglycan-associated lipoprotein